MDSGWVGETLLLLCNAIIASVYSTLRRDAAVFVLSSRLSKVVVLPNNKHTIST
jgi:hypothetical protein